MPSLFISCPECKEYVVPKPVGNVNDDGEYEYMHSECPLCERTFVASDYENKRNVPADIK